MFCMLMIIIRINKVNSDRRFVRYDYMRMATRRAPFQRLDQ